MALLEFYGETCPHCVEMKPLVEKLEDELKVKVEKYEVWTDEKNAALKDKYDTGICGGVPFFYNTDSKEYLCGSVNLKTLKKWATSEKA